VFSVDSLQQQDALEKLGRAVERIERLVEEVAESSGPRSASRPALVSGRL
jgi:hypothetical protein